MALAAETAGILVIREETGVAQIEGLSAWSKVLDRPFIFLSADKDNGYRSRFDLAHEIGHLVLHREIAGSTNIEQHKMLEQQAHRFAGALLLPAESFAAEIRIPPTLDDLLILKRRWGVSVGAMIMRLSALELIDDNQKLALHKRKSYRWGGKGEPVTGTGVLRSPRLIRRTIDLLLDEAIMPLGTMPRHFGLSATDLEMLAGLSEGFFEGKSNVLQFARLKQDRVTPNDHSHTEVLPFKKG